MSESMNRLEQRADLVRREILLELGLQTRDQLRPLVYSFL